MTTTRKTILTGLLFAFALMLNAQNKTITVKSAEEFFLAIGPDRTIVIDSKNPLNLTEALKHLINVKKIAKETTYFYDGEEHEFEYGDYVEEEAEDVEFPIENYEEEDPGEQLNEEDIKYRELIAFSKMNLKPEVCKTTADGVVLPYLEYERNTDGPGFRIRDCKNLTIRSKKGTAVLLAEPRYVNVLEFLFCPGLKLQNLVMGHTLGGYCDNGVLQLSCCDNTLIENCDLFGCGTEGFIFRNSHDITVNNSNVHDCTYHTLHINECSFIRFNDCKFYRNKEFEQVNIYNSECIYFTACTFDDLNGPLFSMDDYNYFSECVFRNCSMEPIRSEFESHDYAIMHNCTTIFGDSEIPNRNVQKPDFKEGKWTDGKTTFIATKNDNYQMNFAGNDNTGFSLNCFSVSKNDYETGKSKDTNLRCEIGIMVAQYVKEEGKYFLRILDDGGELVKSLYYLGK